MTTQLEKHLKITTQKNNKKQKIKGLGSHFIFKSLIYHSAQLQNQTLQLLILDE
jgi:hypothetical protein